MDIVFKILDIVLVFFGTIIAKRYIDSFKVDNYEPGKESILAWFLYVGLQILVVLKNGTFPVRSFLFGVVFCIFLCKSVGGVEIRSACYRGILYYILMLAAEAFTYLGLNYAGIIGRSYGFLLSNLLSKIFLLILVEFLVLRRKMWEGNGFLPKQWLRLLSIPFTNAVVCLYLFSGDREYLLDIMALFIVIAVLASSFIAFNVYHQLEGQAKTERENLLYAQQLNLCNHQALEREAAYQETRTVRHDLKNYLLDLRFALSDGKIDDAKKKIDHILELNEIYKNEVSKTGNLVLDSLINYRCAIALAKKIPMRCRIEVPHEMAFEGADLSIILGNLLDNAMEAVDKLPEEERYIEVTMLMVKGNLSIAVANPFSGEIKIGPGGRPVTSKKDKKNHGIGLTSVFHAVNKYNGELFIHFENNIFQVEILMYPREEEKEE